MMLSGLGAVGTVGEQVLRLRVRITLRAVLSICASKQGAQLVEQVHAHLEALMDTRDVADTHTHLPILFMKN